MRLENRIYAISSVCILLLLCASGCAGLRVSGYGHIDPSGDVTRAFENYEVKPGLNYYVSGSDMYPGAIIGIDKRYVLATELWKKKEFTPETLKELVLNMKTKAMDLGLIVVHGFNIVDEGGTDIGDWYSILHATTSVKRIEDNQFIIPPPPLDIYEENDGYEYRKKVIP